MKTKRRNSSLQYKQVALAMVAHGVFGYAHQRGLIQGIIDYYQEHCAWQFYRNELSQPFVASGDLFGWKGDGVIGEIYSEADLHAFRSLSIPFVNTTSTELTHEFPTVHVDNHAIGRMAAEHLLECELDSFCFVGPTRLCHARERMEGFASELKRVDGKCELIDFEPIETPEDDISQETVPPDALVDALGALKLPVGIMASTDRVGFAVLEACRQMGLESPEDVALIGVDNDEIYCNLAYTPMTSIAANAHVVGFHAAVMLDRLMSGKKLTEQRALILPQRVITRDSTDMTRAQYPEVARALRFIRNHPSKFIDVSDVLEVVPVSRRWLEMKFKEEVGHGIYQEILRVHVECAKKLLDTTDWTLTQIAKESGFNTAERLDFAFQRYLGMSASEYRNGHAQPACASGNQSEK